MVISETEGKVNGFTYQDGILNIGVKCNVSHGYTYEEADYDFRFNRNIPEKMVFEDFFNKKVKITVELLDD